MDKSDISLVFIDNKNGITVKVDNIDNSIRIPAVGEYVRIFFKDVKYRYKVLAIETMYATLDSGVSAMCRYQLLPLLKNGSLNCLKIKQIRLAG